MNESLNHFNNKRALEQQSTENNSNARKQRKYSVKSDTNDQDMSTDTMENASCSDDVFVPSIPQISLESRYENTNNNNVKIENSSPMPANHSQSPTTIFRNSFGESAGNSSGNLK